MSGGEYAAPHPGNSLHKLGPRDLSQITPAVLAGAARGGGAQVIPHPLSPFEIDMAYSLLFLSTVAIAKWRN